MGNTKSHKWNYYILITVLAVGSLLMLFPFVWMLLSAFKSSLEIIKVPPTFFPASPTLEGFKRVLFEAPFFRWLLNSVIVSVTVTFLVLFTSSLAGYVFAKFEFKFKQLIFILILTTMMVPFEVIMIPTYLIVSDMRMLNKLWALIVPSAVSAFGIFLCRQFIEGIPTDLIEAGRIDGCAEMSIFVNIIVPEITPVLSALGIFTFMGSWNNYLWPLIAINDLDKMTVPLALSFFSTQHGGEQNVIMAAATLIMLPVIVVFLLFQRQFIEGLTLTGIK